MKKQIVKLSVFSITSIVALSFYTLPIKAAFVNHERPMAGITLSLDKYFDLEPEEPEQNEDTPSMRSSNLPDADESAKAQASEEEKEKKVVLNLNYDRLGIAKVDNYLNIREEPSESGKIIGKLPKDAGCHIYEIDENGWAKMKSGKVSGYVLSTYLVLDEEAEAYALEVGTEMATVNTETLNVRFLPSTDSSKYTLVPNSEELEVVKENLTKDYVNRFIEKYFTQEEDKALISNVDQKEMMKHLDDWMCVTIDNEKVFVAKEFVDISYQLKKAVSVEELKEDASKGVTSVRAQMVEWAKQYLGNRYVYGGTSLTNGIDCSAFMMRIYQNFGYNGLPRTSAAQANYSRAVSNPKPGDLFFYGNGSRVNHVAMYIGNGQVIHASNPKSGIKISNAYYRTPMKIGRVIND